MADAATLVIVLNAMDKGVFELLLERYGGAGFIVSNKYRYELSMWYTQKRETTPAYFPLHDQITPVQTENATVFTCECGDVFSLPNDKIAGFGVNEFVLFHQIDHAWQEMAPKDRPQWWQYQ